MQLRFLAALLLMGSTAHAHVGANPSKATMTNPPAPTATPVDGGGLNLAPYTWASADASFDVSWTVDFPTDPTGRFAFFYLDHMPPSAIVYDDIVTLASPIPEASGSNAYWVSCSCTNDLGVTCPDAGPRTPDCGKLQFTWNTSAIPAGVYWLIAANNDPPYKIYSVSQGPVRIAHGGASPPPAVDIVLPDGLFATDKSYKTVWIATGVPPLHFDVFYGVNDVSVVMNAPTMLGQDITPLMNGDGSFGYQWDTSMLSDGLYYFGVKVTDATGMSSYTDSQLGENVYHPPEDGGIIVIDDAGGGTHDAARDFTIVLKDGGGGGGCGCELGASAQAAPILGVLAALALAITLRRRRE
jgi:MYXO-CTERM domain-containing protein